MKKQSHTVPRRRQSASPASRHLPLVDILIDAQAELQELVIASGLRVLEAMLEEDRAAVCGPRYAHQPARHAYRAGHAPSQVVLGGHKVAIRRPRVRRDGMEVPLPTAQAFTDADPLNRRVVDQMLIGVATRQYARSLEPLGANITTRATSKSAVSRRFVAQTQAQLDAWRATPLDALDLAVLLIDGVQVGGHCIVVALGIDTTGTKHPLGLWEGATENATVCQGLLTNLASRGLRTDRSLLVIVDGAKALETAVTQTFGRAAVVAEGRCCMKTLRGWGGVARTSLDPPQEPHYRDAVEGPSPVQDEVPRCELAGLQSGPRSTRRCDGVVVLGGDRGLDTPPERPAGRAAAVLGSRHRDRPDPAAPLPSPAAPGRRVPARPVRDDAPRPLRPRRYDALAAQSASAAPSATGPARRGPPSRARQHGAVHRRSR